jgi:hypothetical protein
LRLALISHSDGTLPYDFNHWQLGRKLLWRFLRHVVAVVDPPSAQLVGPGPLDTEDVAIELPQVIPQ